MAQLLQKILGGGSTAVPAKADTGFADFAASPAAPSPVQHTASPATAAGSFFSGATGLPDRPYTKWYRVWERTQPSDFYTEAIILPFIILVVLFHIWGTNANRKRARGWMAAHAPMLQNEFATVGFTGRSSPETTDASVDTDDLLRENAKNEYITYATGRQNIAFLDVKLSLQKRYNPLLWIGEKVVGFFFEGMPATVERMEATAYSFDGREKDIVPSRDGMPIKANSSTYDGFVFAIVNKDLMKQLRNDRYDVSLTSTKDHPKLPSWATIMSESTEIAETMLTPELIKAVTEIGDNLDAFVVSDQPMERPEKLQETIPRKRITLSIRLPSSDSASAYQSAVPMFTAFLRFADTLVSQAHFRPEVMKRIRATREDEMRRIRKIDEDAKAEERKVEQDKLKREKRDAELRGLSSEGQKRYLEKEKAKEQRKGQKRSTMRA